MKFEEAKKYIEALLGKVQVRTVYYVDDYLSYDGLQAILKYIDENTLENLSQFSEMIPDDILAIKEAKAEGLVEGVSYWWNDCSHEQQDSLLKTFGLIEETSPEDQIVKLLDNRCILCSPDKWEETVSKTCLEQIHRGEKVLLLFDLKLMKTFMSGDERNGISLALNFGSQDGVKECSYCGIISQQIKIDKEFEFRNNNKATLMSWAFPFSKDRVVGNEDYTLFIEGLNNLLWVRDVDKMVDSAQKLVGETSKRLMAKISEILPLEFKQLIINSSEKEGCREIDTLLRLIHIIFNRELQRSLADSKEDMDVFVAGVEDIKKISSITDNVLSVKYDTEKVKGFFQDENFVPGDTINNLLTPLQNGDVFCVEKQRYYILLCQPCNIALRGEGKRQGPKDNPYDIGFFIPLEASNTEKKIKNELNAILSSRTDERQKKVDAFLNKIHARLQRAAQGYNYRIKCDIESKQWNAMINQYITISLSLLDFCTFSEDGLMIINKEESPHLHENQKLLSQNHRDYFKKHLDFENLIEGLEEQSAKNVQPRIEGWFYAFLSKLGITPQIEDGKYIFPIRRIGHLQDPLASDLLTQLSHYISRAGLPSEFD